VVTRAILRLGLAAHALICVVVWASPGLIAFGPARVAPTPIADDPSIAALKRLPPDARVLVLSPPDHQLVYVERFLRISFRVHPRVVLWGADAPLGGADDRHLPCGLGRALESFLSQHEITHVVVIDILPRDLRLDRRVAIVSVDARTGEYVLALEPAAPR
jgi:hypothetical protein